MSDNAPAPFDPHGLDFTPMDLHELERVVVPLYPNHLTSVQALNRYAAWVSDGLDDLDKLLTATRGRKG